MRDLGKAVVKPEVKGVWGGESRGGGESHFGKKRGNVTGAPYREVNSRVATAPNTQSRR